MCECSSGVLCYPNGCGCFRVVLCYPDGVQTFYVYGMRCVLAEPMCVCAIRKEGDSVLVLERAALAQRRASRRCCRVLEEKASGRQQVPMPWRCAQ